MARVLIVDDEQKLTDFLHYALTGLGHEVEAYNDSVAALLSTVGETYDVAILDLAMPKLNGEEFLRTIRRGCNWELPVVIFTGHPDADKIRRMEMMGVNHVILKPAMIGEVLEAVEAASQGQESAAI
jgi:DNA-binding response OmpR family regulator